MGFFVGFLHPIDRVVMGLLAIWGQGTIFEGVRGLIFIGWDAQGTRFLWVGLGIFV